MGGVPGCLGPLPVNVPDSTLVESEFTGEFGELCLVRVAQVHPHQSALLRQMPGNVRKGKVFRLQHTVGP